eukprot:m.103705 g.103705  ORF g.103705 m.103705 type:complete len:111 (-) comp15054_c0_seq1:250-582(-)
MGDDCSQDANPCSDNNGGCSDTCIDGDGAHYCLCANAPTATDGSCTSFCSLMATVFPARVLSCADFAAFPSSTSITGQIPIISIAKLLNHNHDSDASLALRQPSTCKFAR